jgi:protein involved in polysaccharide export with SLBB domain
MSMALSSKFSVAHLAGVALLAANLLTGGCSSGPSGGLNLFPPRHRLTDEAKALRFANAPPVQVPRELEKQPLPLYTVEPGDLLQLQPADVDSPLRLPADQPVLSDGTINLGKFGLLQVAGRTVPEIEAMTRDALKAQGKDPGFITVRLGGKQSRVFYVIGAVASPGALPLQGRETVLDAIIQAGGLTRAASHDNIVLSRPTRPECPRIVLPVCWNNIVQLGDTATNYQIAPGDRIYVPSRRLLEMVPFMEKHAESHTPCCGPQTAQSLPPYPGGLCCDPPSAFNGAAAIPGIVDGPRPSEIRLPTAPK